MIRFLALMTVFLALTLSSLWAQGRTIWSHEVWRDRPLDATAVDTTIGIYVGQTDLSTLTGWFKADANVGSPDIKVEHQFWVAGAGWAFDNAGQDVLVASFTAQAWRWIGIDISSTAAFELPGAADSVRLICTGLVGNGADIDLYITLSGGYR